MVRVAHLSCERRWDVLNLVKQAYSFESGLRPMCCLGPGRGPKDGRAYRDETGDIEDKGDS